jgi:hypothetical protein
MTCTPIDDTNGDDSVEVISQHELSHLTLGSNPILILDFEIKRIEIWVDNLPRKFISFHRIRILKDIKHPFALYIAVGGDKEGSFTIVNAPLDGIVPANKFPILEFSPAIMGRIDVDTANLRPIIKIRDDTIASQTQQLNDANTMNRGQEKELSELKAQLATYRNTPVPTAVHVSSIGSMMMDHKEFQGGKATLTLLDKDSMFDQSFETVRQSWKVIMIIPFPN